MSVVGGIADIIDHLITVLFQPLASEPLGFFDLVGRRLRSDLASDVRVRLKLQCGGEKNEEAETYGRKAIELGPNVADAFVWLATTLNYTVCPRTDPIAPPQQGRQPAGESSH